MEPSHPFPAPSSTLHPQWWRIARSSMGFVLDTFGSGRGPGNVIDPLIMVMVFEANLAPINQDPELSRRYAALDSAPPDDLRRPVSINAVAASLRLPYETVRRRTARLVETGALVSTRTGVYVPSETFENPFILAAATARYRRTKAFYFDLKGMGALDGLNPNPPGAPVHEAPPIRAANRIIAEYVLRVIDAIMRRIGDPVSGLILLELASANAEHLDPIERLVEGPIPDERRTPVSVLELSRRVGLPAETVRRHVKKMETAGFCRPVKGGKLAALEQLGRNPDGVNSLADNLQNVQRLFGRCAALGIVARWEGEGPDAG